MLPSTPTPATPLSSQERSSYLDVAQSIVQQTLEAFDRFRTYTRFIDPSHWKTVKSHGNLTVYRQRTHAQHANDWHDTLSTPRCSSTPSSTGSVLSITDLAMERPTEQLLTVGTMAGTVDDILYGMLSHDHGVSSMILQAESVQDVCTLSEIHGPTSAEPFRFLGLKKILVGSHGKSNHRRELVALEATGILTSGDDCDRIGYVMLHSVKAPSAISLNKSYHRTSVAMDHGDYVSTCYLFRQLPHGQVELYVTSSVDPKGRIFRSISLHAAASQCLSTCTTAVAHAINKKLWWLLNKNANKSTEQTAIAIWNGSMAANGELSCATCQKRLTRFHRASGCAICHVVMCSRCSVVKTLADGSTTFSHHKSWCGIWKKYADTRPVTVCKGCLAQAAHQSTIEIAQQEVLAVQFRENASSSTASTTTMSEGQVESSLAQSSTNSMTAYKTSQAVEIIDLDVKTKRTVKTVDFGSNRMHRSKTAYKRAERRQAQELYERMTELRMAAENVYRYTKRTTDLLVQLPPSPSPLASTMSVTDDSMWELD